MGPTLDGASSAAMPTSATLLDAALARRVSTRRSKGCTLYGSTPVAASSLRARLVSHGAAVATRYPEAQSRYPLRKPRWNDPVLEGRWIAVPTTAWGLQVGLRNQPDRRRGQSCPFIFDA